MKVLHAQSMPSMPILTKMQVLVQRVVHGGAIVVEEHDESRREETRHHEHHDERLNVCYGTSRYPVITLPNSAQRRETLSRCPKTVVTFLDDRTRPSARSGGPAALLRVRPSKSRRCVPLMAWASRSASAPGDTQ